MFCGNQNMEIIYYILVTNIFYKIIEKTINTYSFRTIINIYFYYIIKEMLSFTNIFKNKVTFGKFIIYA